MSVWLRHSFPTSRDNTVDNLQWQKCPRIVKAGDISNLERESINYLETSGTIYPVMRDHIAEEGVSQIDITTEVTKSV